MLRCQTLTLTPNHQRVGLSILLKAEVQATVHWTLRIGSIDARRSRRKEGAQGITRLRRPLQYPNLSLNLILTIWAATEGRARSVVTRAELEEPEKATKDTLNIEELGANTMEFKDRKME